MIAVLIRSLVATLWGGLVTARAGIGSNG